ncbi:MAG: SRPBCC family protein [Caulobacter sp.]|jgi:hypothetical protein
MRIEHRIGIAAPKDVIWESLHDLSSWADWNPLYPRAEGVIRIGNTLDVDLALPGRPVQTIQPVILDWAPEDHIHWRLSVARGMVKSVRFLEIEELSAAGCVFSNGEIFSGMLSRIVIPGIGRSIQKGFTDMGEALKARAEAHWQARRG